MIYEFCAENVTLLEKAMQAGARRIELCDNLAVGGTTPAIGVIGLMMMISGNVFLGLIAIIAGIFMVLKHKSNIENIETSRKKIEEQYEDKRVNGEQIIRAILAEIVDFRIEFAEKDAESTKVLDFLEQIRPEQYVNKLASSNRKIKI